MPSSEDFMLDSPLPKMSAFPRVHFLMNLLARIFQHRLDPVWMCSVRVMVCIRREGVLGGHQGIIVSGDGQSLLPQNNGW